jgi:hypothetical protein
MRLARRVAVAATLVTLGIRVDAADAATASLVEAAVDDLKVTRT